MVIHWEINEGWCKHRVACLVGVPATPGLCVLEEVGLTDPPSDLVQKKPQDSACSKWEPTCTPTSSSHIPLKQRLGPASRCPLTASELTSLSPDLPGFILCIPISRMFSLYNMLSIWHNAHLWLCLSVWLSLSLWLTYKPQTEISFYFLSTCRLNTTNTQSTMDSKMQLLLRIRGDWAQGLLTYQNWGCSSLLHKMHNICI